jgi:hypothetical protein
VSECVKVNRGKWWERVVASGWWLVGVGVGGRCQGGVKMVESEW